MSKTIKEKILDFIKTTPVFFDKKHIPYISMTNFNALISCIENSDFKSQIQKPRFDVYRKNVSIYSYDIQSETEKYADKLYTKYQRKVDKFLSKQYKNLLKKAKNGRKKRN